MCGGREVGGELEIEILRAGPAVAVYVVAMAGVDDGGEDQPSVRHRYRICEIMESSGKGRPRRLELMAWDDLTDDDVERLRRLNEPRLRPRQVAELDGKTVARGSEVGAAEVDASEPTPTAASVRSNSPMEAADFAVRLTWDAYHRSADASAELRAQVAEINQQAIQHTKLVLDLLGQVLASAQQQAQSPPPPPPPSAPPPVARPMSTEDIERLVQIGVAAIKEIKK